LLLDLLVVTHVLTFVLTYINCGMEGSPLAGMRFAMYSHSNMWMPEQSRLVEEGDDKDDKKMMETARDFYKLTSTQAPFHERGTAVMRPEASKNVPYNPNVVYTSRPVFKYTCPQRPKTMSQRKKHHNELWRNSAPLEENTPLESFTVGRYFRDSKIGKSAVSVRSVDGRFIPTPPGTGGGSAAITQWSRWFDYF